MPLPRPPRWQPRHRWTAPGHDGCVVCAPFVQARHERALVAIRRVAASLPAPEPLRVESDPTKKQEPTGLAGPMGSTAHSAATEARAARAQSDTRH